MDALQQALRGLRAVHAGLVRTFASLELVDRAGLVVALLDGHGRVVLATPGAQVGNLEAVAAALQSRLGELNPGDAAVTNDPYHGTARLNDHVLAVPVHGPGLGPPGLACVCAPFLDVGGKRLGNDVPEATDLFAEGVRTTPLRLRRGGRRDADAVALLKLNSRVPALVEADLAAMLAAADALAATGAALLASPLPAALLAESGEAAGALLARVPAGRTSRPLPPPATPGAELRVAFSGGPGPAGAGAPVFDFSGSAPQQGSHANTTAATVRSAVARAVAAAAGCRLDSGVTGAFQLVAPAGSVVAAAEPSAVGGGPRGPVAAAAAAVSSLLAAAAPAEGRS